MTSMPHRITSFLRAHPDWWRLRGTLKTYNQLKQKLREAWDSVNIERLLQISPIMPQSQASKDAPQCPLYRRIFRNTQTIRIEPTYVSGVSPSVEFFGVIDMDQFRQRHLSPPFYMHRSDIQKYLSWQPINLPHFELNGRILRSVLLDSPDSMPFHDHLEYRFLRILTDEHLGRLAQLYLRWYHGENITSIFQGDFYALPNKVPHGPIANVRPLLNFTTLWKVFSSVLKRYVTRALCHSRVIPLLQFALYGGSSAVDVLRVVHDHVLDRWFHGLSALLMLDDVRHTFGFVQHETLQNLLTILALPPQLMRILL